MSKRTLGQSPEAIIIIPRAGCSDRTGELSLACSARTRYRAIVARSVAEWGIT